MPFVANLRHMTFGPKKFSRSAGGRGKRRTGQRAKGEKRKGLKSSPAIADNTKTKIVVVVVAPSIVVAKRRAAIIRIVAPRIAPQR